MRDGWIGVNLLIDTFDALAVLDAFAQDVESIERELGFSVELDRDENRRRQILLVRREADPTDVSHWPELHAWTLDRLEAFDRVFRPRIRML